MGWWTARSAEGPPHREAEFLRQEIARLQAMPASPRNLTAEGRLWEWLGDAEAAAGTYRRAVDLHREQQGPLWRELQLESRIMLCSDARERSPTLELVHAGQTTRIHGLACVLGRGSRSTDVCIPAATVAHEHCAVWHEAGVWQVCDLGSTNGTWLNGQELAGTVEFAGSVVLTLTEEIVNLTVLADAGSSP